MVPSDLKFSGSTLTLVLASGFGGGWVAGALGLGGGVIYNPILISMGVPPKVSASTGMYLITFSTIASCFIYFLYNEIIVDYAIWVGFVSTLGAVAGIVLANWYMKKFGR